MKNFRGKWFNWQFCWRQSIHRNTDERWDSGEESTCRTWADPSIDSANARWQLHALRKRGRSCPVEKNRIDWRDTVLAWSNGASSATPDLSTGRWLDIECRAKETFPTSCALCAKASFGRGCRREVGEILNSTWSAAERCRTGCYSIQVFSKVTDCCCSAQGTRLSRLGRAAPL